MGGKSLMKSFKIVLALLLVAPLFADLSIKKMADMVDKIKAKRISISKDDNVTFVSPFVLLQKDEATSIVTIKASKFDDISFTFGGVVNGSAFVNRSWIKLGDNISGYKLLEIRPNSVIMERDEEHSVEVFSRKSKQILHISEEE